MTLLLDTLVYWTNNYLLPPILYLQFDNCVRENKNRYMFALLALLIEEEIFMCLNICQAIIVYVMRQMEVIYCSHQVKPLEFQMCESEC